VKSNAHSAKTAAAHGLASTKKSGEQKVTAGRVLVLADDLTGALEAGAKIAKAGIECRVVTDQAAEIASVRSDAPTVVLSSETRHAPADDARRRIHALVKAALGCGFSTIYKKTDSTLRGNIGSELAGLQQACPESPLFYVPAYPKMGRTVRYGVLCVDGTPVSETSFGLDSQNPVRESSIPKLLAPHFRLPIKFLSATELDETTAPGVYVCDASSDEEIRSAARIFSSCQAKSTNLAAGPSAFLEYFAEQIDAPRRQPPILPRLRKALVISGSQSEVSAGQVRYAEESGFRILRTTAPPARVDSGWWILNNSMERLVSPREVARRLADRAVRFLDVGGFDGLIVFGGDTAYAVAEAMGKPVIRPVGEAIEGIAVSEVLASSFDLEAGRRTPEWVLISKAGGFGPVNVLPALRRILSGE
jgi:D-threonate/D-erythronate kinase